MSIRGTRYSKPRLQPAAFWSSGFAGSMLPTGPLSWLPKGMFRLFNCYLPYANLSIAPRRERRLEGQEVEDGQLAVEIELAVRVGVARG